MPSGKVVWQASAVPFRFSDGGLEFCLITSRKSKRLAFPKGRIGCGQTTEQTALREALEEAGVAGQIQGPPLGRYQQVKRRRTLQVTALLMSVDRVEERWLESDRRQRFWVPPADAIQWLIDRPVQLALVATAVDRLKQIFTDDIGIARIGA